MVRTGTGDGVSPYVDYDRMAGRFAMWRGGLPGAIAEWGKAVGPFLPERTRTVGDIGAGTGVFTRAWPNWVNAQVVGVEPSVAMLASALSVGLPSGGRYVRGVAEALPFADASLDVAWISTAIHHFADQPRAVSELRRVLADDGVVLLRGLLRDRTGHPWFSVFPGQERALLRFPTLNDLEAVFATRGFHLVEVVRVAEGETTGARQADLVDAMRHADSILTALTDAEMADGVSALRSKPTMSCDTN